MKTIYNTYVEIESQEQANRMLALCKEYKLPYWKNEVAFELDRVNSVFAFSKTAREFFIFTLNYYYEMLEEDGLQSDNKIKVTEQEFINLLIQ